MKHILMSLFSIFLLGVASTSAAAINSEIRVELEEPAKSGTYTGISNLRGWAVAPKGIDYVEVYIDGEYAFRVPMGGARGDVGNAFPGYPDSSASGYSSAYNYKNLPAGSHEMTIRAYDTGGDYNETTNQFVTKKFVSAFIGDESLVDVSTTQTVSIASNQSFILSGPTIEGSQWDVLFNWDTATQGFEITDMSAFSGTNTQPSTSNLVKSNVSSDFNGWEGQTIVELANGQAWQQTDFHIEYAFLFNPYIVIYSESRCGSGWRAFFPEEAFPTKGVCVTRIQ